MCLKNFNFPVKFQTVYHYTLIFMNFNFTAFLAFAKTDDAMSVNLQAVSGFIVTYAIR